MKVTSRFIFLPTSVDVSVYWLELVPMCASNTPAAAACRFHWYDEYVLGTSVWVTNIVGRDGQSLSDASGAGDGRGAGRVLVGCDFSVYRNSDGRSGGDVAPGAFVVLLVGVPD